MGNGVEEMMVAHDMYCASVQRIEILTVRASNAVEVHLKGTQSSFW